MKLSRLESSAGRSARSSPLGRTCIIAGALIASITVALPAVAQTPTVPDVAVNSNGDDLVISWSSPSQSVDGYRV